MNDPTLHSSETDLELRAAVARLRRQWRRRVVAEGIARVALAALIALLAGGVVAWVAGAGSTGALLMRVIGYLLIAAALAQYLIRPFLGRRDDRRFALYVEERAPELKQVLVSAVHELETPPGARPSPALADLVMAQAVSGVRRLDEGPGLEGSRVKRAAGMLLGAAAVAALLVVAGPPVLRDAGRLLFIPWSEAEAAPVFAVLLEPGDVSVPRGGALDIRATLRGFEAEGAELVTKADTAADWARIPMLRDSAQAEFTSRLFDLTRPTEYYVESNGVRSRVYRLSIADLPAVQKLSLELRFPAYTGLPMERLESGGDVAAVRGTSVTVRAQLTRAVRGGSIRLDDGTVLPMRADSTGRLVGAFRISRDGFYRLDLVATDGTEVPGTVQYVIEALEDRPPTVRIEEPGRDTKATSVEEITVGVRASDDYGVGTLELHYSVNGSAPKQLTLTDSTARKFEQDARAAHTLFLEEMGLVPGDLVSYFATARDGVGNSASSDIYFLEIRPFGRDYKQAESGGGGGGGGGDSPEGLSARQREIVAGTFNWLRDSAKAAERDRRENVTTLAISQGRLRTDVEGLVRRLVERNVLAADTGFRGIHAALDSAAKEMQDAEGKLGRGATRDALTPEQRALQLVQRAEAAYREVQVQMGGGGGGGGGGQSQAEDLADLFELETDKLRNQYEAVQQQQEQNAQRELDETAERLKRLASRQQQENERMQQMANALRDRMGSQGGGGGGGSAQRQLAQEAEEEARRLERLAREKQSPELADAARRMQEAAEAMRKAASGSAGAQGQGGQALDRLKSATQKLDNARTSAASEGVRELERRAEELQNRQREIAQGVGELPGNSTDRIERMRRLGERKDGLANDIQRLEGDAERLARESRRDQPGAASKLGDAATAIRESRLRDKIAYSKAIMGANSPEASRNIEGLIGQNLDDVASRLKAAAGALSESATASRDRALERARDLVKGLESLRERMGGRDSGSQGARESGSQGSQGQPGEAQGQGREPGQGQGQGQGREPGQGQGQGQGQEGQGGTGRPGAERTGPGAQGGVLGGGAQGGGLPRGGPGGDPRQYAREFGLRRQAAEELRRDLTGQNIDPGELDRIIGDLRRLESGKLFADEKGLANLQAAVIEGLKTWEFKLWRQLGQNGDNRPALGAPAQVPAEYRALVEEYYRALGKGKTKP